MLASPPSSPSPTSAPSIQLSFPPHSAPASCLSPRPVSQTPVTASSSRQPEAQHHLERKPFSLWTLHGAPLPRPRCLPPPCYPTAASVWPSGQNKQLAGPELQRAAAAPGWQAVSGSRRLPHLLAQGAFLEDPRIKHELTTWIATVISQAHNQLWL